MASDSVSYAVSGPQASVEILIDRWGVPHVYATSPYDTFFDQGFNAARDRLWQIDLWRRRGLGLLSEVFGPSFVEKDRAARLFLYRGEMRSEWLAYGSDTKRVASLQRDAPSTRKLRSSPRSGSATGASWEASWISWPSRRPLTPGSSTSTTTHPPPATGRLAPSCTPRRMGESGERKERDQGACPDHDRLVRGGMILEHPCHGALRRSLRIPGNRPRPSRRSASSAGAAAR